MKLGCYLSFYSEIRTVRLILGLGSPLVSRSHSFLSSLDPDPVKSFTSSSPSSSPIWCLWLRLQRATSGGVLALNCKHHNSVMRIHKNLWELLKFVLYLCKFRFCVILGVEFNGEFEVFGTKLIWIRVECELGFMKVLEFFVNFVILICNCQERENWFCLCWCGSDLMILALILTLYPIYKLPCVYLIQWACDMWTWTACVALVDWT